MTDGTEIYTNNTGVYSGNITITAYNSQAGRRHIYFLCSTNNESFVYGVPLYYMDNIKSQSKKLALPAIIYDGSTVYSSTLTIAINSYTSLTLTSYKNNANWVLKLQRIYLK